MWFEVVEELSVDILLGTSFIDQYVQNIFLSKRDFLPWHSVPAYILAQLSKASSAGLFGSKKAGINTKPYDCSTETR